MFKFVKHIIIITLFISTACNATTKETDLSWQEISQYDTSDYNLKTKEGLWGAQIHIADNLAASATSNKNLLKAKYWYEKAAKSGYSEAMYLLGQHFNNQQKTPENTEKTLHWFIEAASKNHLLSIKKLSYLYSQIGDTPNAVKWLDIAVKQGDLDSNLKLGDTYLMGTELIPKDFEKAIYYYRSAAEKGHSSSQLRMGIAYNKGMGVKKDIVEAFKWAALATLNDNQSALYYLTEQIQPNITEMKKIQAENAIKKFLSTH